VFPHRLDVKRTFADRVRERRKWDGKRSCICLT
jgi:hypothetical protein